VDSIGNLPHASQFTTRTRPINKVVGLIVPRAISSMPVYCAELHVLLETAGKLERAARIENNADRNFKDLYSRVRVVLFALHESRSRYRAQILRHGWQTDDQGLLSEREAGSKSVD
jgi:hypothetical protein